MRVAQTAQAARFCGGAATCSSSCTATSTRRRTPPMTCRVDRPQVAPAPGDPVRGVFGPVPARIIPHDGGRGEEVRDGFGRFPTPPAPPRRPRPAGAVALAGQADGDLRPAPTCRRPLPRPPLLLRPGCPAVRRPVLPAPPGGGGAVAAGAGGDHDPRRRLVGLFAGGGDGGHVGGPGDARHGRVEHRVSRRRRARRLAEHLRGRGGRRRPPAHRRRGGARGAGFGARGGERRQRGRQPRGVVGVAFGPAGPRAGANPVPGRLRAMANDRRGRGLRATGTSRICSAARLRRSPTATA